MADLPDSQPPQPATMAARAARYTVEMRRGSTITVYNDHGTGSCESAAAYIMRDGEEYLGPIAWSHRLLPTNTRLQDKVIRHTVPFSNAVEHDQEFPIPDKASFICAALNAYGGRT